MIGMVGLAAELAAHAEKHGPVTIGLAGAGQMGTDIVVQVGLMPGVRIGAISELRMQSAIDAVVMSGRERGDIVDASSAADIDRAIAAVTKAGLSVASVKICADGSVEVVAAGPAAKAAPDSLEAWRARRDAARTAQGS